MLIIVQYYEPDPCLGPQSVLGFWRLDTQTTSQFEEESTFPKVIQV